MNRITLAGTITKANKTQDFLNLDVTVTAQKKTSVYNVGLYDPESKLQYTVNDNITVVGELVYDNNAQYKKLVINKPFVTKGGSFHFCKLMLTANLTKDPELRVLNSGISVASSSIAMNGYMNKAKTTTFANLTIWGTSTFSARPEYFGNYAKKGNTVVVADASVSISTYKGNDGVDRTSLEISGFDLELVGGGNAQQSSPTQTQSSPEQSGPTEGTPVVPTTSVTSPVPANGEIDDSEIPF